MKPSTGIIREFKTKQFRVVVEAIEELQPDFSFDETGNTARQVRCGNWVCFTARATVYHDALGELCDTYLGNCIYKNITEFEDHRQTGKYNKELAAKGDKGKAGSYMHDMITEVCAQARETIHGMILPNVR